MSRTSNFSLSLDLLQLPASLDYIGFLLRLLPTFLFNYILYRVASNTHKELLLIDFRSRSTYICFCIPLKEKWVAKFQLRLYLKLCGKRGIFLHKAPDSAGQRSFPGRLLNPISLVRIGLVYFEQGNMAHEFKLYSFSKINIVFSQNPSRISF